MTWLFRYSGKSSLRTGVVAGGSSSRASRFLGRAPLFRLLSLALAASLLHPMGAARATTIPGMGDIPNGFFFTTDMDPVSITMRSGAEVLGGPADSFELPRAYIYLTSHHSEKQYRRLPSEIEADTIYIVLTYPKGLPYSIALDQLTKRSAAMRAEGEANSRSPAEQLRHLRMKAAISAVNPDQYQSMVFFPRPYERYLGDYGTLKHHESLGSNEVYFGKPGDLIRKISCPLTAERAKPLFFCDYYTLLSSYVVAKVTFVDFRANGGLAFAEDRIRAFKAAICRYMKCD